MGGMQLRERYTSDHLSQLSDDKQRLLGYDSGHKQLRSTQMDLLQDNNSKNNNNNNLLLAGPSGQKTQIHLVNETLNLNRWKLPTLPNEDVENASQLLRLSEPNVEPGQLQLLSNPQIHQNPSLLDNQLPNFIRHRNNNVNAVAAAAT